MTAFLAVLLKQQKSEYALAVSLAGGAIVLLLVLKNIFVPLLRLRDALTEAGIRADAFGVALKALGIGYITGFIADACRDNGQAALAAKAEFAGKCAVFLLAIPYLLAILDLAVGLIR